MRLCPFTYIKAVALLQQWPRSTPPHPSPLDTFIAIQHENSQIYGVASFTPVEGAGYLQFHSFWLKPGTEPHYVVPFYYELDNLDTVARTDPEFDPPSF